MPEPLGDATRDTAHGTNAGDKHKAAQPGFGDILEDQNEEQASLAPEATDQGTAQTGALPDQELAIPASASHRRRWSGTPGGFPGARQRGGLSAGNGATCAAADPIEQFSSDEADPISQFVQGEQPQAGLQDQDPGDPVPTQLEEGDSKQADQTGAGGYEREKMD
jgi:hypothetical protein